MTGTLVADGGAGKPSSSLSLAGIRCFDGASADEVFLRTAGLDSAADGLELSGGGGGGAAGVCPGISLAGLRLVTGDAVLRANPLHNKLNIQLLIYITHTQPSTSTTKLKILHYHLAIISKG